MAQRAPIGPWYRLALNLGASVAAGGLCDGAERPVRWAAESDVSVEQKLSKEYIEQWARSPWSTLFDLEQDEDLLLAEPEHVSLLISLLDRTDTIRSKKTTIISALSLLLIDQADGEESDVSADQVSSIQLAITQHSEAARAAYPELGLDAEVLVRHLLGDPIPEDVPEWMKAKYTAS